MSTILLIDDSEDSRDLVSRVLGEEHTVHTAESWSKAFATLTNGDVDLVLLDVQLPGFTGDQIAEMIVPKESEREADKKYPKIVFFSALDRATLSQKAKSVGIAGFIQKTYDERLLKHFVKKHLK
ncbi:MAG: response regulator [Planctomycetota bacterium]|nr:response regulator [Planctomycetota bacterium]